MSAIIFAEMMQVNSRPDANAWFGKFASLLQFLSGFTMLVELMSAAQLERIDRLTRRIMARPEGTMIYSGVRLTYDYLCYWGRLVWISTIGPIDDGIELAIYREEMWDREDMIERNVLSFVKVLGFLTLLLFSHFIYRNSGMAEGLDSFGYFAWILIFTTILARFLLRLVCVPIGLVVLLAIVLCDLLMLRPLASLRQKKGGAWIVRLICLILFTTGSIIDLIL